MHMRHSTRLLGGIAAALTAAIALTGCAGGGAAPQTADGKTKVVFWQQKFEDYQQDWFKKQVDAFNKSQDEVEVDLQVVPGDAWEQKLQAAQAAGKQPDIATTNYGGVKPGVVEGKFLALDDLLPAVGALRAR